MFHFILKYDYACFLLNAYFLFVCTILTNGWAFLVGNSSLGFRLGCVFAAIFSILSVIRVFTRRVQFSVLSKSTIIFFALLLLGTILFWVKVTRGL
jgi:hypothetical protein